MTAYNLNTLYLSGVTFPEYDAIIVGAGAAGITAALELSRLGKQVALVEAGDFDITDESQSIYSAKVIGDPYFDLEYARLRYFGGTTNHWGGWCRTFESIDFDRSYMGVHLKWPISIDALHEQLPKACQILEINHASSEHTQHGSNIQNIEFKFSPPVRFREKYFKKCVEDSKIDVFLNSNLVDVNHATDGIDKMLFKSYTGNLLSLRAKKFVLAMGGIENSRYLLYFRSKYGDKFIANSPALGRYWMEHPHFTLGSALVDKRVVEGRFYKLSDEIQRSLSIFNCGFRVEKLDDTSSKALARDLLCAAPKVGAKFMDLVNKKLFCGAVFRAAWEQAPNPENRISLDTKLDIFGIPKPILHWNKKRADRLTIEHSINEFSAWLKDNEYGRLRLDDWLINHSDYPADDELAGYHHMGGTRMHNDLEFGVVDADCKVHGSKNLYIAGSSIFTTGGHNNPTLPIVQFSLRLAQHLSEKAQ